VICSRRLVSPRIFRGCANPGVVLRVSRMRAFVPAHRLDKTSRQLAMPESRWTEIKATRSAVRSPPRRPAQTEQGLASSGPLPIPGNPVNLDRPVRLDETPPPLLPVRRRP